MDAGEFARMFSDLDHTRADPSSTDGAAAVGHLPPGPLRTRPRPRPRRHPFVKRPSPLGLGQGKKEEVVSSPSRSSSASTPAAPTSLANPPFSEVGAVTVAPSTRGPFAPAAAASDSFPVVAPQSSPGSEPLEPLFSLSKLEAEDYLGQQLPALEPLFGLSTLDAEDIFGEQGSGS